MWIIILLLTSFLILFILDSDLTILNSFLSLFEKEKEEIENEDFDLFGPKLVPKEKLKESIKEIEENKEKEKTAKIISFSSLSERKVIQK
jgi:hypothetical protein